jgi:cytochrome oxidase Cu insertion factor (SCO1/SenC/PrrC family)
MTRRATTLAGVALAAAVALAGCSAAASTTAGSSGSSASSAAAEENAGLDLGTSLGGRQAPDFTLTNQFGEQMSLSQFKGRITVLSFEDPECTDICPLTTQSMVLAKELLGSAGKSVQLLGVDANPTAVETADVKAYSQAHGLTNQWDYLTGSVAQLKAVWKAYDVAVQVADGDINHTPAVYVIDAQGKLSKLYLTQMAYDSVTQAAQVMASEMASLMPGHPKLASIESLASAPTQTPADSVSLPAATASARSSSSGSSPAASSPVKLGPGQAHLVVFFATWLTEVSDLKSELTSLDAYDKFAASRHLPSVTAVDETVTEPSKTSVASYLGQLGPLSYPVALDETGRLADGYGVQDQPWVSLVSASGKIVWQHDGWVPLGDLEKTVAAHG